MSAPDPVTVNVPALNVPLPANATAPTSACAQGAGNVPVPPDTTMLTGGDVVVSPPLSVATAVSV